jgi:exodeoxyribonuclease VII large subunit
MNLFEAAHARKAREAVRSKGGAGQAQDAKPDKATQAAPQPISVTTLTARIKRQLEEGFAKIWVVGQVSNLSRAASGHVYFTLKDEGAEIGAVIWRGVAQRIPFELDDGQEVVVRGKVAVYERRGRYQIVIQSIQPKGIGALQLAFLQLKDKLEKEGLFDPAHKKPLPFLPRTIGIVTSPTGAAIHDILTVVLSRMPSAHVVICPAAVQGDGAAAEIAAAIETLNQWSGVEVLIVGRGGGSLEDLWPFNEEIVARAIYASAIPVISAVGHEVDVSISDLVADARALTPTQAGEMVVPSRDLLNQKLADSGRRLVRGLQGAVQQAKARLDAMERSYAMRAPLERVRQHQQRLDEIAERIPGAVRRRVTNLQEKLVGLTGRLESLGPRNVLARGYSITMIEGQAQPLTSPDQAPAGSRLRTLLHDGELSSEIPDES